MRGIIALVATAFAILFFVIFAFSTYFTVGQAERGVITHYGAVAGLAEPGLHFKMPFVTGVTDISIARQATQYGGSADNKFSTYSKDQQPADMSIIINWHIIDPICIYSIYGADLDTVRSQVIDPKVYEITKNTFGKFDAVDAIRDRASLNARVQAAIESTVNVTGACVVVDAVQITDISFSDKYETAVEDQMEATVREKQVVAQKNQRITAADAAAYEVTAAADAAAHATRVAGQAEADAIKAKGDALRDNPGVPALIIANKWDGVLPTTMVPGSALPMLTLPH